MRNSQKGSIRVITVLVILVIILIGSYLHNRATKDADYNILTEPDIVNSLNKEYGISLYKNLQTGNYEATTSDKYGTFTVSSIIKGDLTNDGLEDAFVISSSTKIKYNKVFTVIADRGGKIPATAYDVILPRLVPPDLITSGAVDFIVKGVVINTDGTITITVDIPHSDNGRIIGTDIKTYKFSNDKLIFKSSYSKQYKLD